MTRGAIAGLFFGLLMGGAVLVLLALQFDVREVADVVPSAEEAPVPAPADAVEPAAPQPAPPPSTMIVSASPGPGAEPLAGEAWAAPAAGGQALAENIALRPVDSGFSERRPPGSAPAEPALAALAPDLLGPVPPARVYAPVATAGPVAVLTAGPGVPATVGDTTVSAARFERFAGLAPADPGAAALPPARDAIRTVPAATGLAAPAAIEAGRDTLRSVSVAARAQTTVPQRAESLRDPRPATAPAAYAGLAASPLNPVAAAQISESSPIRAAASYASHQGTALPPTIVFLVEAPDQGAVPPWAVGLAAPGAGAPAAGASAPLVADLTDAVDERPLVETARYLGARPGIRAVYVGAAAAGGLSGLDRADLFSLLQAGDLSLLGEPGDPLVLAAQAVNVRAGRVYLDLSEITGNLQFALERAARRAERDGLVILRADGTAEELRIISEWLEAQPKGAIRAGNFEDLLGG